MVLKQILKIVLFTSSVCLCVATSVTTTEVNKQAQAKSVVSVLHNKRTIREIPRLSEVKQKTTSAQQLVQSPAPQTVPVPEIVQVTAVKANPTSKGLEVILQTNKGQQLQLLNRSSGNSFITDIPNAQLRLPRGDAFTFRLDKPIVGVTQITVTNFDAQTIRVIVTGETLVPVVELSSYARVDAALYYTADKFRAAINFKNLFDTTYYEGVQNRFQVYPGAPFTVQGTISWF